MPLFVGRRRRAPRVAEVPPGRLCILRGATTSTDQRNTNESYIHTVPAATKGSRWSPTADSRGGPLPAAATQTLTVRPATGWANRCSRLWPTVVPLATGTPSTNTWCRSTRCPSATCSWILTTLNARSGEHRRSSIQYPFRRPSSAVGAQNVSSRPSSTLRASNRGPRSLLALATLPAARSVLKIVASAARNSRRRATSASATRPVAFGRRVEEEHAVAAHGVVVDLEELKQRLGRLVAVPEPAGTDRHVALRRHPVRPARVALVQVPAQQIYGVVCQVYYCNSVGSQRQGRSTYVSMPASPMVIMERLTVDQQVVPANPFSSPTQRTSGPASEKMFGGGLQLPHRLEPLAEVVRHVGRVLALGAVEPDLRHAPVPLICKSSPKLTLP
ncbi:hypothetical protein PR202_ga16371 [Eleusine coracana subsp. coracana]|uniref:Uncharacterized protein n=1 Tax=Eleusine coracana subsp. coracana TaxID=191504 RepID=A0AAV5CML2_ELECO|nr:hypothetical protein PR202_ga16371 [Eleusine coracana subsp. coracana]